MTAHVTAPAKLTTTLRVTGRRADGMHLIDAEMTTLALHDELHISDRDGASRLEVSGAFARGVPADRRNLVVRALQLVGRRAAVHLVKHIPAGGGLGGGSADAAAILRWAGVDDAELAARLGADVAFCLTGGRARVRGVGELVEPIPERRDAVTLVVPPLHVSTARVYATWDELGDPRGDHDNDLEPAALAVEPRLGEWGRRITELGGQRPRLAGSGATWWLEGHRGRQLEPLVADGATVIETTTSA